MCVSGRACELKNGIPLKKMLPGDEKQEKVVLLSINPDHGSLQSNLENTGKGLLVELEAFLADCQMTQEESPPSWGERPRTCWRVSISHLAWERPGIPWEELEHL